MTKTWCSQINKWIFLKKHSQHIWYAKCLDSKDKLGCVDLSAVDMKGLEESWDVERKWGCIEEFEKEAEDLSLRQSKKHATMFKGIFKN